MSSAWNLDGEAIEADAIVIAMGPWSVLAAALALLASSRVRSERT